VHPFSAPEPHSQPFAVHNACGDLHSRLWFVQEWLESGEPQVMCVLHLSSVPSPHFHFISPQVLGTQSVSLHWPFSQPFWQAVMSVKVQFASLCAFFVLFSVQIHSSMQSLSHFEVFGFLWVPLGHPHSNFSSSVPLLQ
jgi:hypothetical protein